MSFLMGLNDTYAAVRGQILLMDPIPSLTKVFSHLVQDEKQKKINAGKKLQVDSAALTTKNNPTKRSTKGKSGRPQCTHCGNLGHVVDKCYKLHGYPPSYKFKSKGQQASSFANNAVVVEDNSNQGVNLTHVEYQQLLGLLNSHGHFGTQSPLEVDLDTHQVANIITQSSIGLQGHDFLGIWSIPSLEYSTQFFTSITSLVQISVRLPNGDMAKVTNIGTV